MILLARFSFLFLENPAPDLCLFDPRPDQKLQKKSYTTLLRESDIALLLFDVNDPNLLDQTDFILATLREGKILGGTDRQPLITILGNKVDQPKGNENFAAWQDLYQKQFQAYPFCSICESQLRLIKALLFDLLEIVRIYTKVPGRKPESDPHPYILRKGSTILDAAIMVHQQLATNFRFARVWGKATFNGQMVERGYVLKDRDLVEIHM